ncbi:unnamed protein product [Knipowitschia caucasica]|uniref:AIG1-type G domain-containing protein n=1 Tax=Knipowitschia caucasica TaxID=637954 RepID=A0AAV2KK78_KNICA
MSAPSQSELRVVVLGRVGSCILGLQESAAVRQECSVHRVQAADRQVTVVSSADWFVSGCVPEDRRRQLSSLLALSSPGPHAFLLCVPLNQPADGEAKALDVLEKLLGPAVVKSTIVLFTHTEELDQEESLEDYLLTWRKDLTELVKRCEDHYHTLETGLGRAESEEAVRELLDKVDQAVVESGVDHFSCQLYRDTEEKILERQEEILRQRAEEGLDCGAVEEVRQEAERTTDLNLDLEALFPCNAPVSPARSFWSGLWATLSAWLWRLPKLVRREALLGALVGLFVGGPVGGAVGATVGSVATEVGRRKTQKTK